MITSNTETSTITAIAENEAGVDHMLSRFTNFSFQMETMLDPTYDEYDSLMGEDAFYMFGFDSE